MKFLAGFFSLYIFTCSGFYSASVDIANSTITSQTNYTFTLSLDSSLSTFPARFRIAVVLPSSLSLPIPVNTLPNYCTVIDFTEIVIKTLYNPASPSIGQTDSDFDSQCGVTSTNTITLITPYEIPVVILFKIGLITNPSIAYKGSNLGNILFYGYYEGASTYSYYYSYSFGDNSYFPGLLSLSSFTQSNVNVGGWATYTFAVLTGQLIPSGGLIVLSFTSDSTLQVASETTVIGVVNTNPSVTLGVSISGTTATCTGLVSSAINKGTLLTVNITTVKNPKFVGYSTGSFYTATSLTEYIEKATVTIAATNPCVITNLGYIPVSKVVLINTSIAVYFSNDIYESSSANQFYFKITFPTTYTLQSTSTCTSAGGLSTSPTLSCTIASNQFTSNLVTQIGQTVSVRLNNIINPPNNITTDFIKVYLYTSANVLICMNEQFTSFTADPGFLSVTTKLRTSSYVADPGPYNLTFTSSSVIPTGGQIKVIIPLDQFVESTGIQCLVGTSTVNICTKVATPVDPTTVELTMPEWCSATDTLCSLCCSIGTVFAIMIQGIQNPLYINPSVSSKVKVYTYNPSLTGVIDKNNAVGLFTPSLISRTVAGSVSRTGDIVQLSTVYTWQFTSTTVYTTSSNIVMYLPSGGVFPSSIACTNQASAISCTYTVNSDGSIASITFSACPSGCPVSTTFSLQVTGLVNPNTIANIIGSFSMTVFYSTYVIETGTISNTLNALKTNTITAFSVVRSSNIVSQKISLTLAFTISSKIPANGVITLILPVDLLTLDSTLVVSSSTAALSYSGSLTSLAVTTYCLETCSAGSKISLIFTGIRNLASVRAISGSLQVTTSYNSANIDNSSIESSTILQLLLPGTMYNVDFHPYDPTVSRSTDYRIIFTTQNTIPSGASIQISLPSDLLVSAIQCKSYLNIQSTLTCTINSNTVYILNGFSSDFIGSFMIGVLLTGITNPGAPIGYSSGSIKTLDKNGYLIDQYLNGELQYFLAADDCECSECSGTSCWKCIVPSDFPFLQGYSCQETCPIGTFLITSTPYTCIQCHYTCAACSSSLSNACTQCASGYFFSNGACLSQCPSGTTLIDNTCYNLSPCTSPCSTCTASSNYCLTCLTLALDQNTGTCVTPCPDGYFLSGNYCEPCDTKCKTCENTSEICLSCHSYYYEMYLYGNECVIGCPKDITVASSGVCENCDISCNTCEELGSSGCTSCIGELYLYNSTCISVCPSGFFRFEGNLCIELCPDGYFTTEFDCLACDATCELCNGPESTNCIDCNGALPYLLPTGECATVCLSDQFLYEDICYNICPDDTYHIVLEQNYCVSNCPKDFYINDNYCIQCDIGCATCEASGSCTTCEIPYYFTSTSTCVLNCPVGYLPNENNCIVDCTDEFCLTCLISTPDICEICQDKYVLSNGTCEAICPVGTYISNAECLFCSDFCVACSDSNYCTECETNYYLYENVCVTQCPTGFYSVGNVCSECDPTCASCEDLVTCSTCKEGLFYFESHCVPECPDPTILIGNNCEYFCGSSCEICTKGTCSKCSEGVLYLNQCFSSCPDGLYNDGSICQNCSPQCSLCTSLSQCTSCIDSYLYLAQCYSNCPEGTIQSEKNCILQCPLNCASCDSTNCFKCELGFFFYGAECVDQCPNKTLAIEESCVNCIENCEKCSDLQTCEECSSGFLFEGQCFETCPSGYTGKINLCEAVVFKAEAYIVYPLVGELIASGIIIGLGGVIRSDSYLPIPTAMALVSIVEASAKLALVVSLWTESAAELGILVAFAGSLLFASSSLAVIFLYLHLEDLEITNNSMGYYKAMHKTAYFSIKILSVLCGVHFFRMLYSGLFGFSSTTEGKSLGICSNFRFPLEKLCQLNTFLVNLPLILTSIAVLGIYPITSDAWQVSLFTLLLNSATSACFLCSYHRSPWKS